MRRWRTPLILGALACSGCFASIPVDPADLRPGDDLTIELSPQGQERLMELAGPPEDELTGQLVDLSADSLTISTRLSNQVGSPTAGLIRRPFSFARSDIDRVSQSELQRGKTVALVGAIIGAATVFILSVFDIGGSSGPEGPPPPTPTPLFHR